MYVNYFNTVICIRKRYWLHRDSSLTITIIEKNRVEQVNNLSRKIKYEGTLDIRNPGEVKY